MFAVAGVNGHTGKVVAETLLAQSVPVRVIVRDAKKGEAWKAKGAEVAIASRHHPDSRLLLPPRLQGYFYRRHLQSLVFSRLVRWLLPL